jgi:hypothetical protein
MIFQTIKCYRCLHYDRRLWICQKHWLKRFPGSSAEECSDFMGWVRGELLQC